MGLAIAVISSVITGRERIFGWPSPGVSPRDYYRTVPARREDCAIDLGDGSGEDEESAGRGPAGEDCPRGSGDGRVPQEVW